jgi:hypothetical protein
MADDSPVPTDAILASASSDDEAEPPFSLFPVEFSRLTWWQRQKYDLTQKLVPFLDRHLIFPLLEFLSQEDMYPAHDLMQAKFDLMKPTNMMDYTAGLWSEIHDSDDVPVEFTDKREQVLATLHKLEEKSQKVLSLLEDQEVIASLRQDKTQNLQYLKDHHGVSIANEIIADGRLLWMMSMFCTSLLSVSITVAIMAPLLIYSITFVFWYGSPSYPKLTTVYRCEYEQCSSLG